MAGFEPFAADIQAPTDIGGSIMYHVRAADSEQFFKRLQELADRVPLVRVSVGQLDPRIGAQVMRERAAQAVAPLAGQAAQHVAEQQAEQRREPTPIAATPPPAGDIPIAMPVCDEHHKSSWSQHYTGLYCTAIGGKYASGTKNRCSWKHECGATCDHIGRAA